MNDSPIPSSRSRRLNGYDYSSAGAYFITICTKDRQHYFGTIESGELNPTVAAIIATDIWNQIPIQFPFAELDEFVVMPDHIHGIIIINESQNPVNPVGTRLIACLQDRQESEQQTGGFAGHQNPMFHQNLSRIIRWYKGRCSFEIRKSGASFEWQSNYYEHIISDTESFHRICQYIRDNPKNWKEN
ncbi:transposase [Fluviicola taffensis]|uniref:transposase n=1 Tax=Fluviicola taffensis TaxID=191579 RepID=UPI003137A6B9